MFTFLFGGLKRKPKAPKPGCQHCGGQECSAEIECHYCGLIMNFGSRLLMKQSKCKNCGEVQFFHRDCHSHLWNWQPCCHGKYVGHSSGHTINLHDRGHCALCKLATEFWSKWHCSPGVVELNSVQLAQRRSQYFGSDLTLSKTESPSRFVN